MAELEVLRPGLLSSIQDVGRYGYMKYGVPVSGAMDLYAAKMANLFLQNPPDAAVLEITLAGPQLQFWGATEIVVTGADLSPKINEKDIQNMRKYVVRSGDVLSFGKRENGCRAYLGIGGGFRTEEILGSRSWFEGLTEHSFLVKGMMIPFEATKNKQIVTNAGVREKEEYLSSPQLRVYPGPEYELLTSEQKEQLFSRSFSIDQHNNRMGIQIKEPLENDLYPIITGPVLPGTVQLTAEGRLIVLMRDCQTTGGYPRVLQLTGEAINSISQKAMMEEITFKLFNKDLGIN